MKLHKNKDEFVTYIASASQQMGLPEVYIEKDYWITRSLKQLSVSSVAEKVVFKGGTSLSKAHKLIHRFSEDIDLAAIADGLGDARRKALLKSAEMAASDGLEYLPDDIRNSKGAKFRKTVYRYPRDTGGDDYGQASPELLIEVNTFTRPEPYERMTIQTMIADMLTSEGRQDLVEKFDLSAFELNVLSVHRTLVEKLLGIIKDSYCDDPVERLNNRIRHLYDICMILRDSENRDFVKSANFSVLCKNCIADEIESWDEKQTACLKHPLQAAPLFSRFDEWWPNLEGTYRGVFTELVYDELPEVDEISGTLKFLHSELANL